jgi:hypothetical protein
MGAARGHCAVSRPGAGARGGGGAAQPRQRRRRRRAPGRAQRSPRFLAPAPLWLPPLLRRKHPAPQISYPVVGISPLPPLLPRPPQRSLTDNEKALIRFDAPAAAANRTLLSALSARTGYGVAQVG